MKYSKHMISPILSITTALAVFAFTFVYSRADTPATSGSGWTLTGNYETGWVLSDQVDKNTSWTASGAFTWSDAAATPSGLTAQSGTNFAWAPVERSGETGLTKMFTGVVGQAGTYTATFSIGKFEETDFLVPGVFLTAVGGGFGKRVTAGRTEVARPTPSDGEWKTWTYEFVVTPETKNAAGETVVGSTIGFYITGTGANKSFAFDNLSISFTPAPSIPEPTTTAVLAGLAMLTLVIARRKGWKNKLQ
ncbi:hypothetical protein OpiT1DRAFT_05011 [Opitutaceae bacterium TAV1]|nr:hypothetical protein OpiT1DRAFT_05011 [Opitutaceae bacterium TAV1]